MPYEVIGDGAVDVLKSYGEVRDPYTGETVALEHGSDVYLPGDIIPDEDVSPVVKGKYEHGDEHVRSLLKYVNDKAEAKDDSDNEKPAPTTRKAKAKPSEGE